MTLLPRDITIRVEYILHLGMQVSEWLFVYVTGDELGLGATGGRTRTNQRQGDGDGPQDDDEQEQGTGQARAPAVEQVQGVQERMAVDQETAGPDGATNQSSDAFRRVKQPLRLARHSGLPGVAGNGGLGLASSTSDRCSPYRQVRWPHDANPGAAGR
mgnify:CR=1 FL=1